ncbi:MAG: hypothetical protein ACI836_001118 [Saprospiraceae bacterium]|jgi:hypothetical protein
MHSTVTNMSFILLLNRDHKNLHYENFKYQQIIKKKFNFKSVRLEREAKI